MLEEPTARLDDLPRETDRDADDLRELVGLRLDQRLGREQPRHIESLEPRLADPSNFAQVGNQRVDALAIDHQAPQLARGLLVDVAREGHHPLAQPLAGDEALIPDGGRPEDLDQIVELLVELEDLVVTHLDRELGEALDDLFQLGAVAAAAPQQRIDRVMGDHLRVLRAERARQRFGFLGYLGGWPLADARKDKGKIVLGK